MIYSYMLTLDRRIREEILKMALKMLSQSSAVLKIGVLFVIISFILCSVSFATPSWKYDSPSFHYGLWQYCVESDEDLLTYCIPHEYYSNFYTVTGWVRGVQALAAAGYILLVVGVVMSLALLCCTSSRRVASSNPWILLFAAI
ncbi:uncharacterized protein LOC128226167 isoform X1 [Mya arenaria]|uniref:uncharacterized protein LOC128226167 isoform X1 n=1 Tax=Mya arenaria TaxID=6604 RepID=UPI0022E7C978|nr:uncharacterized protein LOC128226167 isoform X1 [Mya arenaria]